MKVLKFGGTSLKSIERIEFVVNLISNQKPCVVVVSAFAGVTDLLISIANLASKRLDYSTQLNNLINIHSDFINKFSISNVNVLNKNIDEIISNLKTTLNLISENQLLQPKQKDVILSTGELLSANIINALCLKNNLNSEFIDTRKLIITDDHFGNAFVYFKKSFSNISGKINDSNKIYIATGFIGSTENGETTTFGRSGSDYTASIIGAAINSEEIEIWTDVNGILTADPSVIANAKTIPIITYEEAMELAHAGAKVIFPPTMIPALHKSIPIRIKNSFEPENPGTLIVKSRATDNQIAVGISSLYNIALVRFQGAGMVGRFGIIGRIFNTLAKNKINIILVSQVFSEHSICFAIKPDEIDTAISALNEDFAFEIENQLIDPIEIESDLSLIAIVGEGMRHTPGVAGLLFNVLGQRNINIVAIAQGSSERNISFIVKNSDVKIAITTLHSYLFSIRNKLNVFVVGTGLVGSELIKLIGENHQLNLCGITNSRKMILNPHGINLKHLQSDLDFGQTSDLEQFISTAQKTTNSVFVDVTSSPIIANKTFDIISSGISFVTASKIANSLSQNNYDILREILKTTKTNFHYEANVGAGLPVIETLQTLIKTGDKIEKIEGIMSGTLGYLFSMFDGSVPFSELVISARNQGLTEPDPRHDLNGIDVARKILILARETGAKLELSDVEIESLIPKELSPDLSIEEFLSELAKFNYIYFDKFISANQEEKVLRYIASWDGKKATVKLCAIGKENSFFYQQKRENYFVFTTQKYHDIPLVIKGPGAGAEVTAAAVLGDILKCKK